MGRRARDCRSAAAAKWRRGDLRSQPPRDGNPFRIEAPLHTGATAGTAPKDSRAYGYGGSFHLIAASDSTAPGVSLFHGEQPEDFPSPTEAEDRSMRVWPVHCSAAGAALSACLSDKIAFWKISGAGVAG
jgi:hypothetical protein